MNSDPGIKKGIIYRHGNPLTLLFTEHGAVHAALYTNDGCIMDSFVIIIVVERLNDAITHYIVPQLQ